MGIAQEINPDFSGQFYPCSHMERALSELVLFREVEPPFVQVAPSKNFSGPVLGAREVKYFPYMYFFASKRQKA